MKKTVLWLCIIGLGFSTAHAAEKVRAGKDDLEERQKKTEEKIKELNSTEWKVRLVPDNPKMKPSEDVLTFRDLTMQSAYFDGKGFRPTNYTVTVEDEEADWETMKTHPGGGGRVVFMRGHWKGDKMHGVATEQDPGDKENPTVRYTFVSSSKAVLADAPDEKKAATGKSAAAAEKGSTFSGAIDMKKVLISKESSSTKTK